MPNFVETGLEFVRKNTTKEPTSKRWFWYQLKASMRFPISDQWQPWSYLAPFRRYGNLLVEKSSKLPNFTHPRLVNRPRSVWPLSNFGMIRIFLETRMFGLSEGEETMMLAFFVLIQYRSVTDRQTDGHSFSGYTSACIACYANALVKIDAGHGEI